MSRHPYRGLPSHQFWRDAVAGIEPFRLDPVVAPRFRIGAEHKVATAGSCFAQHVSRRLPGLGLQHFITEDGAGLPDEVRRARQYGVFSARYGNVYTTRQMLQLFEQAVDGTATADPPWRTPEGNFVDALRPQVTPGGHASEADVRAERATHLKAVRRVFCECDVFVFTLGLTEAWRSREDGTVFPLAPGVVAGEHDPARYEFVNFGIDEVRADLDTFLRRLRALNPGVRVLLSVSPVPLAATFEPRHVLVSTTFSKSVLRVAADAAWRAHDFVDYFPSYEIITGAFSGGTYYEDDCRGISALGVAHAMRCFSANYTTTGVQPPQEPVPGIDLAAWDGVTCDEEALARIHR